VRQLTRRGRAGRGAVTLAFVLATTAAPAAEPAAPAVPGPNTLRIVAASTLTDTGVLTALVDDFRLIRPRTEIVIEPTGALRTFEVGREGRADLIITHHRPSEDQFVEQGYGLDRSEILYDDYVLFGPPGDPLRLRRETDLVAVLKRLAREQVPFLSPAAASGTTQRINALWEMAGVTPDWVGYTDTGSSAAATLLQAAQFGAYAIADTGTYLANREAVRQTLAPLYRDHPRLRNVYSAIVVNGHRVPGVNQRLAAEFLDYLVSDRAQRLIQAYGTQTYGAALYTAAAHLDPGRGLNEARRQNMVVNLFLILSAVLVALILVSITYMSRYRKAERARRETEERFILAVSGTNDAIWDWDVVKDQVYFSTRWKEMLGYIGYDDEIGTTFADWMGRIHPEDLELTLIQLDNYLEGRSHSFVSEHRLRTKRGDYIWVLERAKALWDPDGKPMRLSGAVSNINERKLQSTAMEHQALHDLLTDLPNRTLFVDRIEQALSMARRESRPLAVLAVNLNRFREINDTLGHFLGDRVLQQVGQRLRAALHASDTLARLGGDEFGVLLPVIESARVGLPAQRLLAALDEPIRLDEHVVRVSASIGITLFPDHGEDAETLIQRAVVAMYTAKHSQSGYASYTPPAPQASRARVDS
jgi:diguanylate cyclase (GGDEF)-like protein/PAS domain S-box-containing protein